MSGDGVQLTDLGGNAAAVEPRERRDKFYHELTDDQLEIIGGPVHRDDRPLVDSGMDHVVVKGLRQRRKECFGNEIEGGVHAGRLSRFTMMCYAPPSLTTVPLYLLISVYVIQFYENVGASLGLLAFFQALARGFDVITDPTMSYISDSCRHKMGRRRPFLFYGAPLYGMCLFCLLTPPPSLGETGASVWFGLFYIAFFLMSTFCNIPYDALAPELTDNPEDRNLLFFMCTMFDGLGSMAAAMLPLMVTMGISGNRQERPDRYTSCNNPGSYTLADGTQVERADHKIDALSAVGSWFFGSSSAPGKTATWEVRAQREEGKKEGRNKGGKEEMKE